MNPTKLTLLQPIVRDQAGSPFGMTGALAAISGQPLSFVTRAVQKAAAAAARSTRGATEAADIALRSLPALDCRSAGVVTRHGRHAPLGAVLRSDRIEQATLPALAIFPDGGALAFHQGYVSPGHQAAPIKVESMFAERVIDEDQVVSALIFVEVKMGREVHAANVGLGVSSFSVQ